MCDNDSILLSQVASHLRLSRNVAANCTVSAVLRASCVCVCLFFISPRSALGCILLNFSRHFIHSHRSSSRMVTTHLTVLAHSIFCLLLRVWLSVCSDYSLLSLSRSFLCEVCDAPVNSVWASRIRRTIPLTASHIWFILRPWKFIAHAILSAVHEKVLQIHKQVQSLSCFDNSRLCWVSRSLSRLLSQHLRLNPLESICGYSLHVCISRSCDVSCYIRPGVLNLVSRFSRFVFQVCELSPKIKVLTTDSLNMRLRHYQFIFTQWSAVA